MSITYTTTAVAAVRQYRRINHIDNEGLDDTTPRYEVNIKAYNYLLDSWFAFAVTDLPTDKRIYEITHVHGEDYVMVHSYTLDDPETKIPLGKD